MNYHSTTIDVFAAHPGDLLYSRNLCTPCALLLARHKPSNSYEYCTILIDGKIGRYLPVINDGGYQYVSYVIERN